VLWQFSGKTISLNLGPLIGAKQTYGETAATGDMRGSELLLRKMMSEPHFADRKSLL